MPYAHQSLEQKWQKYWSENKTFRTETPFVKGEVTKGEGDFVSGKSKENPQSSASPQTAPLQKELRPKKYILDMFPYPSGAGLHVGHPKGYTATDIISRYYHANGYNVLHPMGWDAFGLPAENYAIKTGTHPAITTAENVATFRGQMQSLGFSYDWSREIDTTDPEYYKWTQWIFLELFKRGLAYEQDLPINYCPSCKTGLANEEVLSDNTCDRCGTLVERRPIRQWVLKITEYADRLIDDLEGLDWPEGVKEMQRNWIGKSEGLEFRMMKKVEGKPLALVLHGWDDTEDRTDWHWMAPLKKDLESIGYEVIMEQLPGNNAPNLDEQLAFLEKYKDRMDENSLVVGHSMGGFLGMHFVQQLNKKIGKLICVAPVFNGLIDHIDWSKEATGWEIGSASMRKNYNPEKIQKNVSDWHIFLSENDKAILYPEAKKHFDSIGVPYTMIPNAGHFCESDGYARFPLLLERITSSISVYTTRVDTVYGMTYAVMAPDHPRVSDFITDEQASECEAYITEAMSKSDQDRTNEGKEKTGVFTGSYVVNPYNGEAVPLWIADYVLGHYGTGAVMAVPAHDERDGEFARKYHLPIRQSIARLFTDTSGQWSPKSDKKDEERDLLLALLRHHTEDKYLCLDWKTGWKSFIPGGTDGESLEIAGKREIHEETGYKNINFIHSLGKQKQYFFAPHKDINRIGYVEAGLFQLVDDQQDLVDTRELEKHTPVWVDGKDIERFINLDTNKYFWEKLSHDILETEDGFLVNSGKYDWMTSAEARKVLTEKAETEGFGHKKVNYKLRDWLFSRQRYWGEPIPLIHLAIEDVKSLPHITDISQATDMTLAYILKREPLAGEECTGAMCHGKVRELIIDGKVFSKIYDGINGKIIIDSRLPLVLPEVERYEPAGDGQSPLATVPNWVNVKLADNLNGKRETNTMPQWGGSCWYYLRFMDAKNQQALAGKEALEYWQNVDEYVGGAEHAVLHLLYARFWHKVLYDAGIVTTKEPFQKLTNVGMILAYAYEREDGGLVAVDLVEEKDGKYFEKSTGKEVKQVVAKMSKSLKNVVNPNDIVAEYGADTLRLYEMSMGAFTDTAPWNPDAIIGVRRFLDKVYVAFTEGKNTAKDDMKAMKLLHKTVKKVGEDIVGYKFNTAISALMILVNEGIPVDPEFASEWKEKFAIILHPFAPHMGEELWNLCHPEGNEGSVSDTDSSAQPQNDKSASIYDASWPEYDEFMLVDDEVTIAVQVNGKLRGTLTCFNGVAQDEVSALAHADPSIAKWIEGKELVKEIFIPNKMLSIVVRD